MNCYRSDLFNHLNSICFIFFGRSLVIVAARMGSMEARRREAVLRAMQAQPEIDPRRIKALNTQAIRSAGAYVLYWCSAAQRSEHNHALEFAARQANALHVPLVVCFGLTDAYPEASERHYAFMLEGLVETAAQARRDRWPCRGGHACYSRPRIPMPARQVAARGAFFHARLHEPPEMAIACSQVSRQPLCDCPLSVLRVGK